MMTGKEAFDLSWKTAEAVVVSVRENKKNFEEWGITQEDFIDSDELSNAFATACDKLNYIRPDGIIGQAIYRFITNEARSILYSTGFIKNLTMQDADFFSREVQDFDELYIQCLNSLE